MKTLSLSSISLLIVLFCSCSGRDLIDEGRYHTFAVNVASKAIKDSIDWTNATELPVFEFSDRKVLKIENDYLSSFGDTVFRYRFTDTYLILKSKNQRNKYKYRIRKSKSKTELLLDIYSDNLNTIDLIQNREIQ